MSIPLVVREQMNMKDEGKSFYIKLGRSGQSLSLYPQHYYERQLKLPVPPDTLSDDAYAAVVLDSATTELLEPDAQGRVVVPKHLLDLVGIGPGEVALSGANDHLELWSRSGFEAFVRDAAGRQAALRARLRDELTTRPSSATPTTN